MKSLRNQRLVIATHNGGKLGEFSDLLLPFGVQTSSAGELGLDAPDETETTFTGNARLKALHAAKHSKLPALADDSGLCVEALDGAPGVFTADWAGPTRDWAMAMRLVEEKLQAISGSRRAYFQCTLCLAWPDGEVGFFEGQAHGSLIWPPRGKRGFGYDPMFVPDGETLTFGEMDKGQKEHLSHRSRAFEKFVDAQLR